MISRRKEKQTDKQRRGRWGWKKWKTMQRKEEKHRKMYFESYENKNKEYLEEYIFSKVRFHCNAS